MYRHMYVYINREVILGSSQCNVHVYENMFAAIQSKNPNEIFHVYTYYLLFYFLCSGTGKCIKPTTISSLQDMGI